MIYKGKEVITLKQVPRRVRELHKDYHFLAMQLNKCNIMFRWILPEGMLVTWQGKKLKIDSLGTAQGGKEEEQSSKEEVETTSQEEELPQQQDVKEGALEKKKKEEKDNQETKGSKTRTQRVTRENRY